MIVQFPQTFLFIVIVVSLIFSGVAAATLLVLIYRDKQQDKVW